MQKRCSGMASGALRESQAGNWHAWSASAQSMLEDARRCARFVREAARHRVRSGDVYVSSYPRSGTTWVTLLVHLVRGGDLSFDHISQVVPWYERSLSLGRATAADYDRLPSPRTFKSHLPYAWLPRGARYIYAMRDAGDVVVSYYHLYRSHLDYTGTFDAFFERFMRGSLQYRSWFRHVADFQREARRPEVLLIRYEEMRRDPARALWDIARLCGCSLAPARERAILEATSFEAMKRIEPKLDHESGERLALGLPSASGDLRTRGNFVRQGRVGGFREVLTPTQQGRLAHAAARIERHRLRELHLAAFLH